MYDKIKVYILAVLAAVVPLIVRIKIVPFIGIGEGQTNISQLATGDKLNFFHFYKAVFVWVIAGALLFILLGQIIDRRAKIQRDNKLFIAIGTLALFTIASSMLSLFPYVSIWGFYDRSEGLITYMAYFALFIAAYSIDFSKASLRPFKWGISISTIALSLIGVAQFYGYNFLETGLAYALSVPSELADQFPKLSFRFKDIAYATLFNPNYVGSFTAIAVPFFLSLYLFEQDKKRRITYSAISLLSFAFMVASGSRAGLIGITCSVILIIAINRKNFKRDWKRYASMAAAILVVASIMNFHNPARVFGKINSLFSDAEKVLEIEEETEEDLELLYGEGFTVLGSGRGYIWYKSAGMIKQTVLMGNGPDTYVFHFPHREAFEEGFNKITDKPHNIYLQIGINQGVVALLAFLFINIYAFRKLFKGLDRGLEGRRDQALIALAASIFGYLATSLFNDSVVSVAPLYWAMLGMLFSVLAGEQKGQNQTGIDL